MRRLASKTLERSGLELSSGQPAFISVAERRIMAVAKSSVCNRRACPKSVMGHVKWLCGVANFGSHKAVIALSIGDKPISEESIN